MPTAAGVAVRLLPMGDDAMLVETGDIDAVLALEAVFLDRVAGGTGAWAGVVDVIPSARTVLLVTCPGTDLGALASAVRRAAGEVSDVQAVAPVREVEVPVRYDGPDLDEVAALTGLAPDEVVAAHTGTPWRVAFCGFAPGFAYLVGGDPRLAVPRRGSPRTRVPAGAVGLAGEFSGIYPRPSPGGWRLIGTTDAVLWDTAREPAALLRPRMSVRFVQVPS